jgi:uncharacterized protein YdgA (DUF945 family)
MKKIIAGAAVILVAAVVFAPFVNGLVMERIIRQAQDDLNTMYAETGSGISVEIMDYQRSFASSEIEWRIGLGHLAAIYGIEQILLVDRVEHRFTGVVSRTSLERNRWFTDFVNSRLDGNDPLHITTMYRLTGPITSVVEVDAFSLETGEERMEVRPAKLVAEFDEGFTHLKNRAVWEGLSVGEKAGIHGVSIVSELEKISTYIWEGDIEYSIDSGRINDSGASFSLAGVKGGYGLDFNGERESLSIGGELGFQNLTGPDGNFMEDAFLRLDVNNLDAEGYEEFMELYTTTVQDVLGDFQATGEEPEKMERAVKERMAHASLRMIAAYEKFLKEGLEIRVADLHAAIPEGEIKGHGEIRLKRDVTFAQFAAIAARPDLAFEILDLETSLTFPGELAGGDSLKLTSPLSGGMQTGLFILDGKNLAHRAETRDGKLFLNGLEVVFH